MEIREDHGLRIAVVSADEALAIDRRGLPSVSLVRVVDPEPDSWDSLSRAGFVRRPDWVTWIAATPSSTEEYARGLPRKARQDLARAMKQASDAGLRFVVQQPAEPDPLDRFLRLYAERVDDMAHGVAFATTLRETFLHSEHELAVFAFDGDELVGGCLCREVPEERTMKLRFSAVTPGWRARSLARVIYLHAFGAARLRGCPRVTLGNDPNLYGHVAKPGLLVFKARLGFDVVPAGLLGPAMAGDSADLLVSLDGLTDPSVILRYADGLSREKLAAQIYGSDLRSASPDRFVTRSTTDVAFTRLP